MILDDYYSLPLLSKIAQYRLLPKEIWFMGKAG